MVNIVIFGETGVGKSSVVNLIAGKKVAEVSPDVDRCTLRSEEYTIRLDFCDLRLYDTVGLDEPQLGVTDYLTAIEKAYALIHSLRSAGGVDLLMFCIRGGRLPATLQNNYRLFSEFLCHGRVPIALVITNLERELNMEDWWQRNCTRIEENGINAVGHACITATPGLENMYEVKYMESRETILELLKTCSQGFGKPYTNEKHTWFVRLAASLRNFVPQNSRPGRKRMVKQLTTRCGIDREAAEALVERIQNTRI
ncbi:hypothetical protein HYDPIDRAFT_84196 [Hydnomerulius pinastri MD-312]|nr:hypothetical protein HYDPIDRAFT_84196 [Hydnomerulius pinastri MD-312]